MIPLRERFDSKWTPEPFSGCWLWTACTNHHGYGRILINGKARSASRTSYELHFGNIPEGQHVLHRCDTPSCVNPNHLFLGTALDNLRDAMLKDRRGLKLSLKQVAQIRSDSGTQREIAKTYGISSGNVSLIKNRKTWRHTP